MEHFKVTRLQSRKVFKCKISEQQGWKIGSFENYIAKKLHGFKFVQLQGYKVARL